MPLLLLGAYRTTFSGITGGACRFHPSCSEYANQALINNSFGTAVFLIVKRLGKCRPGGPWGYDPVPGQREKK